MCIHLGAHASLVSTSRQNEFYCFEQRNSNEDNPSHVSESPFSRSEVLSLDCLWHKDNLL